jgi:hypothetical protein
MILLQEVNVESGSMTEWLLRYLLADSTKTMLEANSVMVFIEPGHLILAAAIRSGSQLGAANRRGSPWLA